MVGVPGRSRACLTCRARRKGCTRERPACAQCLNAGLQCGGYDAPRIFVVSTPQNRRSGYSVSGSAAGRSAPTRPTAGRASASASGAPSSVSPFSGPTVLRTAAVPISDPHLLTQPATEQRCFDLFWEAYFPSGAPIPQFVVRSYTCTWTETARRLCGQDDALRYALWANCLLTIASGRTGGQQQVLGALSEHEAGLLDQAQRWRQHHFGELALLLSRRPEAHTSGDAHYVFTDERAEMALSALLSRKQLPLEDPEWKSVPWREIPRDLKDVLVDVLVDVPGLVERYDKFASCTDASNREALRREVLERCQRLDSGLSGWFDAVRALAANTPPSDCLKCDEDQPVVHVARVVGMGLYYTTAMVLYSIFRIVDTSQESLPAHADPELYATKLADAIDILLKPWAGLYGRQSAALPLAVALDCSGQHRRMELPRPDSRTSSQATPSIPCSLTTITITMAAYTDDQLSAYLRHISFPGDLPTVRECVSSDPLGTLTALQRRHMARVPFESLSLHYSRYREVSLHPQELFEKVVGRGRGGYCMEVNTFFATILRGLGYTLYSAGGRVNIPVIGYTGWDHMVNLVTISGTKYLVDVGFGSNGATQPVPLRDGYEFTCVAPTRGRLRYQALDDHTDKSQRLWVYATRESPEGEWTDRYAFTEIEFLPGDFEVMNLRTSTSPRSFFVQSVMCMWTVLDESGETPVGLMILHRDYVKRRVGEKTEVVEELKTEEDRVAALEKYFGIKLSVAEQNGIRGLASELRFNGGHA
ncbi:hypothetical protein VTJ49DRAFT_498 [Mycothermus thermophilus]|uniref:Zn(2)-C6 fungal-type domain-containing protein n=1 Tax=Humicola insolens TaxID=85995 RepID=A0ABR3VFA6_HUMIN